MDLTKTIKDALERLCDLAEYGGGHPLDKKAAKIIRKEFLKGESSWRPAPADIREASLTARLDEIAGELERVDPRLALALDQVSDRLERVAEDNTITLPQAQRIYGPEVSWKLDEKDLEVINALLIKFPKRTLFGLTKEIKEALLSNKK